MLAYVRLIQSREKELGVEVFTHQKWSGAPYMDGILGTIQSGSSTNKSMGEGNTEIGTFYSLFVILPLELSLPPKITSISTGSMKLKSCCPLFRILE
jgi:isocitrate lyase family protein